MSIVDDLVKNLISQNSIKSTGAFTITLIDGGLALTGKVDSNRSRISGSLGATADEVKPQRAFTTVSPAAR
jgi:hypothetical protein